MITAFIGKGGVGKTSVASAFALSCARKGKTIVVSSDFMPSLRHIFNENVPNLEVLELSEKEVAQRWKDRYGKQVTSVLREFVDIEDWVLDHIAGSPGVAEEFMIANIVELEESGEYQNVVWDTAASSSTMHLLLLEKEFYEHLDRDVRIYLKLKSRFRISSTFRILEEWKELANNVWNKLLESRFYLVSTQDELSLVQSDEIEKDLEKMGIPLEGRIYNRCGRDLQSGSAGSVSIPELKGSSMDIVRQMEPYLSRLSRARDVLKHL